MKLIERRIVALEKQTRLAVTYQVILYHVTIGPPSRQPTWPPVLIFLPCNARDAETEQPPS